MLHPDVAVQCQAQDVNRTAALTPRLLHEALADVGRHQQRRQCQAPKRSLGLDRRDPEKVRYVALEVLRAVPIAVRDLVVNRQISAGHDWGRTQGIALLADLNDT